MEPMVGSSTRRCSEEHLTPWPAIQDDSDAFGEIEGEHFPTLAIYRGEVLLHVGVSLPLEAAVEVTGPGEVELWIASSALDTDFTAKLIDVYPPNEDYPDGYDMLINDSIIRTRFREGFDREVMMEPGTPYLVRVQLPPTSNVFAKGHRIRIDVSSSNFPGSSATRTRASRSGSTTQMVTAQRTVFSDAERPSRVTLPVVPRHDRRRRAPRSADARSWSTFEPYRRHGGRARGSAGHRARGGEGSRSRCAAGAFRPRRRSWASSRGDRPGPDRALRAHLEHGSDPPTARRGSRRSDLRSRGRPT
jgi:hypothetical protein